MITEINGAPILTDKEYTAVLNKLAPEQIVTIKVMRLVDDAYVELELETTIGVMP